MTEKSNPFIGLQYQRTAGLEGSTQTGAENTGGESSKPGLNGEFHSSGLEPWTFVELLLRRLKWLFLSGAVLAVLGFVLGQILFHPSYSATVKLLRLDPQNGTEFYKPRQFSEQTYPTLLRAPALLERVAAKTKLSVPELNARVAVTPLRDSEIVLAMVDGPTPEAAVDLANLYAQEAVRYTQEIQAGEAGRVNNALKQQLAGMNAEMQELSEKTGIVPDISGLQALTSGRAMVLQEKLQLAHDELANLLSRYTTNWPPVQEQQAKIALLEKQLAEAVNQPQAIIPSPTKPRNGSTTPPRQGDMFLGQFQSVAGARITLASRQREAQIFSENAPGYCQVLAPATKSEIAVHSAKAKTAFLGVLGFVLGFGGALVLVMLVEFLDERLKTAEDLKRVTRLPLLATLGDLSRMPHSAQSHWAFRTWTSLQNRLSISPNHGLVCGLTSSQRGEGRSTWIGLLAQAASECGFRVLTIATDTPRNADEMIEAEEEEAGEAEIPNGRDLHPAATGVTSTALTTSVLASPGMVTEKLTGQDPQPYVHIPFPGWVWNLERRKQWQSALSQWSKIDNIVILVELPPAYCPEAVLLAENLPNLLWLADSRNAQAGAAREQLQTLREARCHLVGAVLNYEAKPPLKKRLARWVNGWALLAGLGFFLAGPGQAQPAFDQIPPDASPLARGGAVTNTTSSGALGPARPTLEPTAGPTAQAAVAVDDQTNKPIRSFSVVSPTQRAPWQQRLTLGPGDSLNIGLFGQPDASRTEVLIGPDGRISYLQAAEIQAAGLTIDELRAKLDEELAKYYRTPRTIISPATFRSKKYYVLGKVTNRGVYTLDQPITLLEAVAKAKGLETGLVDFQNSVDLADLQRSFLMRQGKRVPVDLEKLFQEGDLTQNVPIEPEDYLYFAAANLKEVYVLGEVASPGPAFYTAGSTVVGAISARGGFTEKAYKGRVLVIRGSLNRPQTFVVDVWGGLEARTMGFRLESKDIIYIAHRPFVRVEELLDLAATAFIQSAISAWGTGYIDPIIRRPILP